MGRGRRGDGAGPATAVVHWTFFFVWLRLRFICPIACEMKRHTGVAICVNGGGRICGAAAWCGGDGAGRECALFVLLMFLPRGCVMPSMLSIPRSVMQAFLWSCHHPRLRVIYIVIFTSFFDDFGDIKMFFIFYFSLFFFEKLRMTKMLLCNFL